MILPAVLLIAFVATSNKPALHTGPPAIALEVARPDGNLSRIGNPSEALTTRLGQRFPPGTPVAEMRRTLEAEGYVPVPEKIRCKPAVPSRVGHRIDCWTPAHPERQLVYAWGRDDCNEAVAVRWDEDARSRLTTLSAEYRTVCR
jgi:hypothetical protein